jgi:GT2 family glycosyltransferase
MTTTGPAAAGVSADGLVSFVIIAYNEQRNIGRTLASIAGLSGLGAHEIIVVNDGSRDDTAGVVREVAAASPRIRLIDLAENRGRGWARNTGVRAARGDLIATVDADIVLPGDWLVRARAALPGHAAVGGTAVPDGDVAYLHRRFGLTPRPAGHSIAVTGSNALYRRDTFALATFDASLREGEDSALNHAMSSNGLSLATVPGLLVEHTEDKSLLTSLRWLFDVGRGATRQFVAYRQVRGPDLVTAALLAAVAAGAGLAAAGYWRAGLAGPAALVVAASAQHVRTRFATPVSHAPRVLGAIAVDALLLTAYFAGRLAGLAALAPGGAARARPRAVTRAAARLRRARPDSGR